MMSVLIEGMKKPETCGKCPFCQFGGLDVKLRCLVTDESIINFDAKEKRAGNCPLVEIPSHGRLIDADNLIEDIEEIKNKEVSRWMKWLVDGEPTVIESEEEKDD